MSIRLLRKSDIFHKYTIIRNILKPIKTHSKSYAILPVFKPEALILPYRQCRTLKTIQLNENDDFGSNIKRDSPRKTNRKQTQATNKEVPIDLVLHRINMKYRQNGAISGDLLENLLKILENSLPEVIGVEVVPDESLTLFMNSCCPDQMPDQNVGRRLEFFQRLWDYMKATGKLSEEHVMIKLKVFKENRIPIPDHKAFVQNALESYQNIDESQLYREILRVTCAVGKTAQAAEIMLELRNKNVALTVDEFNALLQCEARNKDLEGIDKVLTNMMAAGLTPNIETQAVLICAYLENEKPAKAAEILDSFKGQFDINHVVEFLRTGLVSDLDSTLIQSMIQDLPKTLLNGPEVPIVLRNVCIELLHNKKWSIVKRIMESLPGPIFNDTQNNDTFGVFLLHELVRCNTDSTLVLDFAKYLKESGKNPRALHIATEFAMLKSPPLGLPYLEGLSKEEPLRPHYFWPLIMYNFRRHGESGILRTLSIMSQYGLASDPETFKEYVLPRLAITLEDPIKALRIFSDIGVKISAVFTPILATLIMQQKSKEILVLLELYPTKLQVQDLITPLVSLAAHVRVTKAYESYVQLIAEVVKRSDKQKMDFGGFILCEIFGNRLKIRNDFTAAQRIIKEMHKAGITISTQAKETMQNILNSSFPQHSDLAGLIQMVNNMCDRSLTSLNSIDSNSNLSSFVKHPRDMSYDELEYHLIELEAKQMNTRGVLRKLLQMCVRENRLERALQIKAKCDERKVQNSPGMMASIVDLYIKSQDLPNALSSLKALQAAYPAFLIDEHKEIELCSLLVKENRYDEAIKNLENRAARHKINGGDYIVKNVWKLLSNVAHYASQLSPPMPNEENLTRNTFSLLSKLKYCRSNNTVLGPIIREWLLRGNLKAAVDEFSYIAKQYRHTPLQYELISLLITLSNNTNSNGSESFYNVSNREAQQLLQQVTSLVTSVHGVINMNSSLLLAFAESGTDSQIRRLLMNPNFQINDDLLMKNCDHLNQEGAIATLLRLAKGCRGMQRLVNEQKIYQMLLDKFIKENNATGALKLYENLESDDELKISPEFLKNLVNLLKVNNMQIPSNIALRAQVI